MSSLYEQQPAGETMMLHKSVFLAMPQASGGNCWICHALSFALQPFFFEGAILSNQCCTIDTASAGI